MRFIGVVTVIYEDKLEELKRKTGKSTNKDALAEAVYHYIDCFNTNGEKTEGATVKKNRQNQGRPPLYLLPKIRQEK